MHCEVFISSNDNDTKKQWKNNSLLTTTVTIINYCEITKTENQSE